jgi:hypothetical protein
MGIFIANVRTGANAINYILTICLKPKKVNSSLDEELICCGFDPWWLTR